MASTYRLSGLTIFLILLAVLLIGYLLNHTWEYFSNRSEGFVTDYKNSSLSETVPGYSTDIKEVVQLDDSVYFDPVSKIFIEKKDSGLVIRKRDGNEHTSTGAGSDNYRFEFLENKGVDFGDEDDRTVVQERNNKNIEIMKKNNVDDIRYSVGHLPIHSGLPGGATNINSTLAAINTFMKNNPTSFDKGPLYLRLNIRKENDDGSFVNAAGDKYKDGTKIGEETQDPLTDSDLTNNKYKPYVWLFVYSVSDDIKTSHDGSNYPTTSIINNSSNNLQRLYKITRDSIDISTINNNVGNPKAFGFVTEKNQAILYFPLLKESSINDDPTTSVSFVHVMDLEKNKHIATYYFNGNQLEMYPDNLATMGRITGTSNASAFDSSALNGSGSSSTLSFTGSIEDEITGTDFKSKVEKDTDKKLLFFAARHNNEMVRAYISIADDNTITIKKSETKLGELTSGNGDSDSDSDSDDDASVASDDSDTSDDNNNSSGSNSATINELTNAMNLINRMQGLFGSSDSNYLLKTEVVPPVCPTCPSCPNSGVCTDCGGKGGSGTKTGSGDSASSLARDAGTGATNLVRDGADGATNIARDAASGTLQVGKDVISGTKDTVGEVASGTGEFVKDGASGVYGAAKDVTQGTVGLGREIVQGVGGIFGAGSGGAGPSTASGGYYNSYGGPGGYGYPQPGPQVPGGYMNPGQYQTPGQDPYSYYGAVPGKAGGANYMPRTADFSSFGR